MIVEVYILIYFLEEIDTNIFNVSFSAIEDENNKYKIH